jgi:CHAT domain-containing protein
VARLHDQRWAELSALHGIGDIYYELGDASNALVWYGQYIDLAVALASKSDRSIGINAVGLVHLELEKDYDRALAAFQEALDLAELIGYTLMQGVALANIGVTLSRQGDYQEALSYHDRGLELVRRMRNRYTEMQGLHEKGETYHAMGEYDRALDCLLEAERLAGELRADAESWKYRLAAGKAYQARGDLSTAVQYYRAAAATLAGIKGKIRSEKLRKGYGEQEKQLEVYRRLIDLLIETGRPEEALRYIEESKSKIIRDAFGEIAPSTDDRKLNETLDQVDRYEKKKQALEKQLQEEMSKPDQRQDRTKLDILSSTLATTQREFNQWMLKLQFQNRRMYESLTINPTTLADIQEDIPADTLILEYFVSASELYVFSIGKDYFNVTSVQVSEEEIARLVTSYMRRSRKPSTRGLALLERDAALLYDYLVRPVEGAMERFRNVVIVPFGVLYYLPFHALVRRDQGETQYLIERTRISYTTSATIMDLLSEERRSMETMLALGNPDGSLPGASEEVRRLKDEIFKNRALVWTLAEASKENFFSHAHNYHILHIATHGLIEKNPLDSYLLLAGTTPEQQRLTLLDVAGYTALKQNTQLVFLSACRTAAESSEGEHGTELITLAQAFAIAGPPTLIATLWEVSDRSTSLLVYRFYRELAEGASDTLDALRAAQLSLLRSEQYRSPFYWAPFVMIGSWR